MENGKGLVLRPAEAVLRGVRMSDEVNQLEDKQVRLDLVQLVLNGDPNMLARLASMVLCAGKVSVDGSDVFENGDRGSKAKV